MSNVVDPFDPERFRLESDDLSRLLIDEPPEAQAPPGATLKVQRNPRPQRLVEPYVRVPVSWFTTDPRPALVDSPRARLFLLVLHESRFGQKPVVLTENLTKRVGVSRQHKWRLLRQLERDRWIVVKRDGNKAVIVRPIVIAG